MCTSLFGEVWKNSLSYCFISLFVVEYVRYCGQVGKSESEYMNKQVIKIALAFVLSCSIAYLIGQKVVLPLTDKKDADQKQEMIGSNGEQDERKREDNDTATYDLIQNFTDLSITGQRAVDDNPWGSNLTTFEDEGHGTCLLMTPGTEISACYVLQGEETLRWNCNIHPWMAEISDGVHLTITVCGTDQEQPKITESFLVTATDSYKQDSISLAEYAGRKIQVTLSADNGDNNDSSGDWLVFDHLGIEPVESQN